MNKALELLQFLAQTAYKTQETVKTLSLYFEDADISVIQHLYILTERIKLISLKWSLEISGRLYDENFDAILNEVNNSMESAAGMYAAFKKNIPGSVPENLRYKLDANMKGLMGYCTQLKMLA